MPQWLCKQLMQAYRYKDRKQVRLLNDCWFFYRIGEKKKPSKDNRVGG